MTNKRNSSIELLKIFAIVLIILSHSIPMGYDYGMSTRSLSQLILVLFSYGGKLGNDIFIICSAWFLLDNSKVNKKKIFYIISDCFFVSLVFLITFICLGYDLPLKVIVKQIFPIWMSNNWFISCYILLYMIHGILNKIIDSFGKVRLLRANIILLFLYYILNLLHSGSFFYSDIIGFICIYFNVAYMKKYLQVLSSNKNINFSMLTISIVIGIGLILLTNFVGLHIEFFSNKMMKWNVFINPLIILNALALFNLVKEKNIHIKAVNYLSSLSLLIYVIHDNRLLMDFFKNDLIDLINRFGITNSIVGSVLIVSLILTIFSICTSIMYKYTLKKVTNSISDVIYNFLEKAYFKIENVLLKI